MPLLEIKNLHAQLADDPEVKILKGLDLTIERGEVHSIMGPNGSGKSTLASVLAGHEAYEVTDGEVLFDGVDLLEMEPDERAVAGLFLAFQYPVEVPGVSNTQFLKAALNARRKARGEDEIDALAFVKLAREKAAEVNIKSDMLKRSVNEGFSGGEKKRFEIFQMALLEPKFAVLDETDSGLDIDALKVVADGVNAMRSADRGYLVITHYQRLLNYIVPDFVHVLVGGKIVRSGGKDLALELEEKGYADVEQGLAV
jgi:Fe-S cluster assembly ATP-binding protein